VLTPDWDMFHSRHPAARAHAAARAASGGPAYVSDAPGRHDFSVLSSLVLEDGRVLRARLPGRPTPPTLFSDPTTDGTSLLTVWNVNDHTALVAVTHAQGSTWSRARRRFEVHDRSPPRLGTTVRPADLPLAGTRGGSAAARPWVAHVSGAAGLVLLPDAVDGVRVELGAGEAAVVTLAPVASLAAPRGAGGGSGRAAAAAPPLSFAPVGAASMLNAGGAITAFTMADASEVCGTVPSTAAVMAAGAAAAGAACGAGPDPAAVAAVAAVHVKGLKEILCYSSTEPLAVVDAGTGEALAWRYNARDGALRVAPPRPEGRAVAAACDDEDAACPPGADAPAPVGDWGFEVALPQLPRLPPEEDAAASAAAAVQ
jgi:raffinose synthase